MRNYKIAYIFCLILSSILFLSCGNIFGNKKSYGNIKVLVMDNKNNPISGAIISTYPSSKKVITDNEGRATIENIQAGGYCLIGRHPDGYKVEKIINIKADKDIYIEIIFSFSNVRITLKDGNNRPIAGARITTYPLTPEVATDQEGVAVLENLFVKEYTFVVVLEDCEIYRENLNLKSVEDQNLDIVIYYSSIEVTIKDDFGQPLPGVVITTDPPTVEIITDDDGRAVSEILAERTYTLYAYYAGYLIYNELISVSKDEISTVNIVYETKSPEVTIISPEENDNYTDFENITLKGIGDDREDGELPDSSLVWYSSIDGELGYGKELVINQLSSGEHQIKLVGIDSHQKKGESIVNIKVLGSTLLEIIVKDDLGRPIPGVVITTSPETTEIITDENGKGILEIITGKLYTLYSSYAGQLIHQRTIKIWEYDIITTINIVYKTKSPEITILSPQDDDNVFSPPFIFSGMGSDIEDGELPDSALVWYSSIDGELGYGKELVVESLSEGKHVITLVGTDSDQKKGEASVNITFIKIIPGSYFPISAYSYWTYRHLEPEFIIINEYDETEEWKLNDISVSIDYNKRRTCYMEYQVLMEKEKYPEIYNYEIVDFLEEQGGNINVIRSHEYIEVIHYGSVTQKLEITTVYTPHYLLIKNFLDPMAEKTYKNDFTAEVTWYYHNIPWGSREFVETFDAFTTVNVGDMGTISTDVGNINAVPFTIVQGSSVKKWWLTSGIGIVRLEYNTINSNSIADIYSTNISGLIGTQKISAHQFSTFTLNKKSIHKGSEKEGIREMKKKVNFFRGMCPR